MGATDSGIRRGQPKAGEEVIGVIGTSWVFVPIQKSASLLKSSQGSTSDGSSKLLLLHYYYHMKTNG